MYWVMTQTLNSLQNYRFEKGTIILCYLFQGEKCWQSDSKKITVHKRLEDYTAITQHRQAYCEYILYDTFTELFRFPSFLFYWGFLKA